jgi:hypothetical protein
VTESSQRGAPPPAPPAVAPAPAPQSPSAAEPLRINLRDPLLAAFLAWLIPGAGHFYQRRWGKGGLFMVCILGSFFVGLWMGQGRVVYASFRDRVISPPQQNDGRGIGWRQSDDRWFYLCQIGVGLPSLPALVQALRTGADPPKEPLWNGWMAPPLVFGQRVPRDWAARKVAAGEFDASEFPDLSMPQPAGYVSYLYSEVNGRISPKAGQNPTDPYSELSAWNFKLGAFFEIGTIYTVIAGLLNVLAIYDAWGGPVLPAIESDDDEGEKKDS